MKHALRSLRTWSYWRYALFSRDAIGSFFAALGVLYLFVDISDAFKVYSKDKHSTYGLIFLVVLALIYVLTSRRPVSSVSYKVPKQDFSIEVRIADIFKVDGETIISSSTTFDTDMTNGLISPNSLQGQVASRFFQGKTAEIDKQITASLASETSIVNRDRPGKTLEYSLGTIARVSAGTKNFYFVAMSHMGADGNASSDQDMLDAALARMWVQMRKKAELGNIVIPLLGTGRGRIDIPRRKIIEKIAQSFADASSNGVFSKRLIIVVTSKDAEEFSINLFQIKDYLRYSLYA